jgi:two-component system nitrogen regulation sensor histidine kinase NtrY
MNIWEEIIRKKLIPSHSVVIGLFIFLIGFLNFTILAKHKFISEIPFYLIALDVVLIVAIGAYIYYRFKQLFSSKRREVFNLKFQTKMIMMVGSLCVLPIVVILCFTIAFFNVGTKSWFNNIIGTALDNSQKISNIYIIEHHDNLKSDLFNLKKYSEKHAKEILLNSSAFESGFAGQASSLSLTEAVLFVDNGKNISILAKTAFSFFPSVEKMNLKESYKPNDLGFSLLSDDDDNYIRAVSRVDALPNMYLLVGRLMNDKVVQHINEAKVANFDYQDLKKKIYGAQKQFIIVFVLVLLLIILALTLISINYFSRIFLPIIDVILANRKIAQGEYDVFLDLKNNVGEVNILVRSFNRMIKAVGKKHADLSYKTKNLEKKNDFFETVLANLPAAILVLDVNKKIKLFNKAVKVTFNQTVLANKDVLMCIKKGLKCQMVLRFMYLELLRRLMEKFKGIY